MEFLEHNAVELILLDISMPGQSGMDLLKLLDEKKRPHVIILTGFATFEMCIRDRSEGTRKALNIWLLSLKDDMNVKYSGNAAAKNHMTAADQYSMVPGVILFFMIPSFLSPFDEI